MSKKSGSCTKTSYPSDRLKKGKKSHTSQIFRSRSAFLQYYEYYENVVIESEIESCGINFKLSFYGVSMLNCYKKCFSRIKVFFEINKKLSNIKFNKNSVEKNITNIKCITQYRISKTKINSVENCKTFFW